MKTIGNIFKQKFKNKNLESHNKRLHNKRGTNNKSNVFDFIDLIHDWNLIIGENLSKVTSPLKIKNKCLTILTSHPAFSQQLSIMENEVISKITAHFPSLNRQIKKVFFVTNPEHFQSQNSMPERNVDPEKYHQKNKLNKYSPHYQKLKSESEQLFKEVKDKEIKNYLSSIYIQLQLKD